MPLNLLLRISKMLSGSLVLRAVGSFLIWLLVCKVLALLYLGRVPVASLLMSSLTLD